jgi:hypothetical protein
MKGEITIADDFDAPLPSEVLNTFDGESIVRLLLDTSVILWVAADNPRLSKAAPSRNRENGRCFASSIALGNGDKGRIRQAGC